MNGLDPKNQSGFFGSLAEHTSDVLWVFSRDCDELLFVTSAYEDVWGCSLRTLREDPTSLADGVHPDDRGDVTDAIDRLSAGESIEIDVRVNPTEEYRRWVTLKGGPVDDDHGDGDYVLLSARDITERKTLQATRKRHRTILNAIPDGVYFYDEDNVLRFVNQAVVETSIFSREQMLGESVSELVGRTLVDDISTEEVVSLHNQLVSGEREEIRRTLEFDTKDGPRPYAVRSARGENESGECIGVVSVLRDITERVELEEELYQQNERLEEFTGVVSHDLRNPLNVAQGRLELARAECDSDHLEDTAHALDRIETLIDDLLTLARQGETVNEMERIDLDDLVESCWLNVETAEATLVTETGGAIRGDRSRVQQLFENLIRNAVEHGGADVTVTVGDLDDGFYITDDGPGFSEGEREQAFESGYSTMDESSGLGLTIVETIADAHDWTINVTESETGGVQFDFTGVETVDE